MERMRGLCLRLRKSKKDTEELLELAKLHDIGYSEKVKDTGFHPYDGYKYISGFVSDDILNGVLLHTNARELSEYCTDSKIRNFYKLMGRRFLLTRRMFFIEAITYCDITTDSKGNKVTISKRLEEINQRYGEEDYRAKVFKNNIDYYNELVEVFNL